MSEPSAPESKSSPLIWIAGLAALILALVFGARMLGSQTEAADTEATPAAEDAGPAKTLLGDPSKTAGKRGRLDFDGAKAAISGTIRDTSRNPIPGAQVCAFLDQDSLEGLEVQPSCARSEADGHYRIEGLWPTRANVHASAPEFIPNRWTREEADGFVRREVPLVAGQTSEGVDIELERGGVAVRGVVRDISGGEIDGALVTAGEGSFFFGMPGGSGDGQAVATTAADGTFEVWVAPGRVNLGASIEGYADGAVIAVAPGESVELFLTPESILVGRVVLAGGDTGDAGGGGQGVEGVTVNSGGQGGHTARTDADGRFRIAGLEPGTYKPRATSDQLYGVAAEQVHLGLGETSEPVVIQVHPAVLVVAQVVVTGGGDGAAGAQPCKHGSVRLSSETEGDSWATIENEDGFVEFRGLMPGTYRPRVDCGDHVSENSYPEFEVGDKGRSDLVWEVRPGLAIRGEVVDADGVGVAKVRVFAQPVLDGADARAQTTRTGARTKDDGSFELTGLLPGRYELGSRDWSGEAPPGPDEPVSVVLEAGIDQNGVRIELPAVGQVRGRVLDENGQPISGANVSAELIAGNSRGQARTNDAGEFEFAHLHLGETRITAADGGTFWGGTTLRAPGTNDDDLQGEVVEVVANGSVEVDLIVASQAGVIRGTVRDSEGAAVADAFIDVERMPDRAGANSASARRSVHWSWGSQPVLTEPDGSFELRELPEGQFIIRAHRRGGGEAVAEEVALGSTVELVIESTGELAGRVVLTDGSAPERFTLSVQDKAAGYQTSDSYFRTDGGFRLTQLPAGSYEVTAAAPGGTVTAKVELGEGEAKADLELRLDPRLTIRGRIIDLETREGVPGLSVFVSSGNNMGFFGRADDGERRNVTDASGNFEVEDAPSGNVMLAAWNRTGGDDSKYDFLWHRMSLAAEPIEQDIGVIEIVAKRLGSNQDAGDLGFKLRDWDPTIEPEDLEPIVAFVRPDGPAAGTGIEPGDVVETVDGHPVTGTNFSRYGGLIKAPAGTTLEFGIRGGKTVAITLGPPV